MNNYCTYLNLPFPLFKESIDPLQFPKTIHFTLNKDEVLNEELQNWFKLLKLEIFLVEVFYTPPNTIGTVHIDSIGGDYTKLNWQFGGSNSVMNWYSINEQITPEYKITPIGSKYTRFEQHEVTKVHSQRIQNPSLIQVGKPHNIENFLEDRWVVSVVYKYSHIKHIVRPTWTESSSIFNEYLIQ
jgi:hypothetical protein